MFAPFMVNAWIVATLVAIVAGAVGFFVVLRGSAFVAHAIPNGSFAGAAGATLLGVNVLFGLGVCSLGGALGISALTKRGRSDVATALTLAFLLALGALFLSLGGGYAPAVYSLLFGEVLGISVSQLVPTVVLCLVSLAALALIYRPLLLNSALPESAPSSRVELAFLLVIALATTMTVPVVGTTLIFSLLIGPAATARAFVSRPGVAILVAICIALVIVWVAIGASYLSGWPVGFFVGSLSAVAYATGRAYSALASR
ncbi:MAG: metal ABC transporter permease [Solirubrobacterales bacterium]|nr:metal ABC transporter permease [Solirubrobacterales bacterium]